MSMRYRAVGIGAMLAAAVAIGSQPPAPEPAPPPAPTSPAPSGPDPGSPAPTTPVQPSPAPTGPAPASPAPTGPEKPAEQPPSVTPNEQPAAPPTEPPAPPSSTAEPREAIVLLHDGQRYTGLLVSRDDEKVVLKIAGIETTIPASQIDRVSVLAPVLDRYRSMRSAIDDNDVENLLRLVEWLRARSQWEPALAELDHILQVQPDSFDAKKLRTLVLSQKKLADAAKPAKGPHTPGAHPAAPAAAPDFPLLPESDINIIKVYEVDLNDPPRMTVERRTIDRLLKEHTGDPAVPATPEGREALYRANPAKVLELLFKVQARAQYGEVQVIDHPRSMRLFRDEVQRSWLVNSCATSKCHGGAEAGRLRLCNQKAGTDAALYTNFLILDRFRLADGRPLINYDEPAKSPLLQLGLPRDGSTAKHPEVHGAEGRGDLWRPIFRSTDERHFQGTVEWIKAMYRPRPEYPVVYNPPAPLVPKPPEPPAPR